MQLIRVIKPTETTFGLQLSKEAEKCHFLQFLVNTGNFKPHIPINKQTDQEQLDVVQHLCNKLSAIGYLLHDYFDPANAKAVVLMDAEREGQSDGESYGRSGKSLVSDLLKEIIQCVTIDGKKPDIDTDKHLFSEVDERTQVIIMDDIRRNFDFESLLSKITGNFSTRAMYQTDTKIAKANTPKFLITTNHSIKGATNNSSFEDRIHYCVFSDFYNKDHKPIHDFHQRFFDDWEHEQWNLTWNLVACCVQIYLEHKLIEAPGNLHIQKQQRGEIGDNFMDYLNAYFIEYDYDETKQKFNGRFDVLINKATFYTEYLEAKKNYKYAYKDRTFWNKLKQWCSYHGFEVQGLDKNNRIQKSDTAGGPRVDHIKIVKISKEDKL